MAVEKKKILVLFGKANWEENIPFKKKPQYRFCYERLYSMAEKENIEIFRASYGWFDWNKKVFSNAWAFYGGEWKKVHDIVPDAIYDKTKHNENAQLVREKLAKIFKIFNDPAFTLLLSSKLDTSLLFPEYMKKSYSLNKEQDLLDILPKIKTEKIVLKPINGSGGDGVEIIDKNIAGSVKLHFPALAQEFIDSSKGIAGLTDSIHDLRIVVVKEEIIYAYIRTPKKGSLLANLAQGGTMKIVTLEEIPQSVLEIVKDVKNKLANYGDSVYTIDLMFDENNKPWVIELNTMPGMYFAPGQEECMDRMYSRLIEIFKAI